MVTVAGYCGTWSSIIVYHIFIMFSTILISPSSQVIQNQLLGIKYINYTNYEGTLANGDCCDEPGKSAGSCSPDMCDTAFLSCATTDPNSRCNVVSPQSTPTTFNKTSIVFGANIGNTANRSTSLIVLKFPFIRSNINFSIEALKKPSDKTIALFDFIVDWRDPIFRSSPNYRRFVLNDTRAQLVVDVVSQCSSHYYTENCSVYCKSDKVHYKCLDNGTIECLPGWSGPKCLKMIDYCPGNNCQHGSTCVPILLNYTCTCAHSYTGHLCETPITTTTTPSGISITNPIPTTTAPRAISVTTSSTVSPTTTSFPTKKSQSRGSDSSGDDVTGLAVGLTIGLLFLLALIGLLIYYVMKKKEEESQISPEKKHPLDEEGQVTTPKSTRDVSDIRGLEIHEDMRPKAEIMRSLDEW